MRLLQVRDCLEQACIPAGGAHWQAPSLSSVAAIGPRGGSRGSSRPAGPPSLSPTRSRQEPEVRQGPFKTPPRVLLLLMRSKAAPGRKSRMPVITFTSQLTRLRSGCSLAGLASWLGLGCRLGLHEFLPLGSMLAGVVLQLQQMLDVGLRRVVHRLCHLQLCLLDLRFNHI
jgi:hypothetical protein